MIKCIIKCYLQYQLSISYAVTWRIIFRTREIARKFLLTWAAQKSFSANSLANWMIKVSKNILEQLSNILQTKLV